MAKCQDYTLTEMKRYLNVFIKQKVVIRIQFLAKAGGMSASQETFMYHKVGSFCLISGKLKCNKLTLLHLERQKLHRVLAVV